MVSLGARQRSTVLVCAAKDGQDVKGRDHTVPDQLHQYVYFSEILLSYFVRTDILDSVGYDFKTVGCGGSVNLLR